jgi:hypothetical protein
MPYVIAVLVNLKMPSLGTPHQDPSDSVNTPLAKYSTSSRAVVFKLRYAKTSYGICEIKKILFNILFCM